MQKFLFNDGFEFKMYPRTDSLLDISTGMDDADYAPVKIPHDAVIHDTRNFYTDYALWYRKRLSILPAEGRRLFIYFEGVYMETAVYINGRLIGRNVNGYNSFWFDITDYVTSVSDTLYVSIDYRNPNSRWYAGPGINRNVWLMESNETHICPDSIYVCPNLIQGNEWELYAAADFNGKWDSCRFICEDLGIFCESGSDRFATKVITPKLWDPDSPNMYDLRVELYRGDKLCDSETVRFGFRNIELTSDRGMFINGRHIKLNGVCLHSDEGCLGTAFHIDAARRQLKLMKDMGANAIRGAHNIQAPEFLDLCDEMGLLVLDEAFDCWKREKTAYDYARFFNDWSQKDIASWIRRDRNHPCVIMWSAGNEIYDTHAGPEGRETLEYIRDEIKKHDYKGHAEVCLCSNYMAWDNTINAVESIGIAGYNYGEYLYAGHHKAHPDWVIFGSETASCVQSRGIYHFPLSQSLLVEDDEHCSSLGNSTTSWGAVNLDFCLAKERDTRYSLGQFYWSGTDYLGEPTPYHTKSSYFGMADTAGFPKDAYFLNQSEWIPFEQKPVIHILPYWDFNNGQIIDVRICSNAPEVELFFNGSSLGRQKIDHAHGQSLYADYRLPYSAGELKAVGYDRSGLEAVTTSESSFGDTAAFRLSETGDFPAQAPGFTGLDHTGINDAGAGIYTYSFEKQENDTRLRFIEIEALDRDGHPVRNASDKVNIVVEGPAQLIGIDNGNNTDYESFKGSSMRLFSGKLLAVIEPEAPAGLIKVSAIPDAEHKYVRKLEITADATPKRSSVSQTDGDSTGFECLPATVTPDDPLINVSVRILPSGASCKAIEYQISNDAGIPIPHAVVESVSDEGSSAVIRVLADAEFRIRALCRENDDQITCISQLEFKSTGFGALHATPYAFVSGSLYSDCIGSLGNGNEKGIATSRTEDNYILYSCLDFGKTGSDTVTLSVFELESSPTKITFWNGMPHGEGSRIIGTGIYHKKSIWNVYQDETFTLDEPLTGLTDFGIEVNKHKLHLKGFIFTEKNTAFDINMATGASNIYGDDYTVGSESVDGIGNNVSLIFENMDFGQTGAHRITVCGRTPLDCNTIHIRFSDGQKEIRQVVEFCHSDDFSEQSFELEALTGKGNIVFLFLPGSSFDFKWFRFE